MNSNFWLDVLKALIGTAVGAGLAFASNYYLVQHVQRRRDQYAAAVTAMEVLRTQLDDFRNYRRGFREELGDQVNAAVGDHVPQWIVARPTTFYFFESLRFDYASLAFVLEYGGHEALARVRYAERRYHELAGLTREYNAAAQRKHERMSEKIGIKTAEVADVKAAVGPEIVGRLESMIGAIQKHLELDEKDYLEAETWLAEAVARAFPKKPKLSLTQARAR
jgi:hypothetical protein